MTSTLAEKILSGARLSPSEGLAAWDMPLMELGAVAQELRYRRHPGRDVTFVVDSNPNYSNICEADCLFCAFYRREGDKDAYTYTPAQVAEKAKEHWAAGVTTLLLQGGLNPRIPFQYYLDLVAALRAAVPEMHLHLFSAPEYQEMVKVSGKPLREVLQALYDAGLRTIPGGGAEILSDRVRIRMAPKAVGTKQKSEDWLSVHREAHAVGFRSTATMMYGHFETPEDIVTHLESIRKIQDETGGFTAFVPWSFKPGNTVLERKIKSYAGPAVYMRMLAFSRVYLDNFDHIQASWFSEGKKTGQMALHFGADDFGGTLLEENVHKETGFINTTTVDETVRIIQDAGFVPVQRNTLYGKLRRWEAPAAVGV